MHQPIYKFNSSASTFRFRDPDFLSGRLLLFWPLAGIYQYFCHILTAYAQKLPFPSFRSKFWTAPNLGKSQGNQRCSQSLKKISDISGLSHFDTSAAETWKARWVENRGQIADIWLFLRKNYGRFRDVSADKSKYLTYRRTYGIVYSWWAVRGPAKQVHQQEKVLRDDAGQLKH